MSTLAEMWQPVAVAEGATLHWQLGTFDAWIRKSRKVKLGTNA
jgi:hypothetical protein